MTIESLLVQKKADVLGRWRQLILEAYPSHTSEFLQRQKDRFCNPVGYAIARETEAIFDCLLADRDSEPPSAIAERLIKIRAVQDFTASDAVGFIFRLKSAVREHLALEIREHDLTEQLLTFESRVDELALCLFDTYMRCREKIFNIRINEIKNGTFKLFERLNPSKDSFLRRQRVDVTREENLGEAERG